MYKFEKLHRCYLPKRSDPVLDPDLDRQAPDVYPDWQATAEDSTGFGYRNNDHYTLLDLCFLFTLI